MGLSCTVIEIWCLKYWTYGPGHRKKDERMERERRRGGKGKVKESGKEKGRERGRRKGMESKGKGKGNGKGLRKNGERERGKGRGRKREKGRWKEDSLRNVGRMDTKVILYSVQCYALHWTDNNSCHGSWYCF